MASFESTLLLLLFVAASSTPAVVPGGEPTEPTCYHWDMCSDTAVSVLEGEVGRLSCPLFCHPSIHNYTSDHKLVWHHLPEGHDLEQPIVLSSRISIDGARLWLLPAATADAGLYICMLRNRSSCIKMATRLKVPRPDEVVQSVDCAPPVATAADDVVIPLQEGKMLDCPDLQEAANMADSEPTVTWLFVTASNYCQPYPFWNNNREQIGARLQIHIMYTFYQGWYYCTVSYQKRGQSLKFTRKLNVSPVLPTSTSKEPSILLLTHNPDFPLKHNLEVRLVCRALFPYLDSSWEMWWTVDGKTLDKLPDHHRFNRTIRLLSNQDGERTEESVLLIKHFQSEDLNREINCSAQNQRGSDTRRAELREEASLPSVELSCGLGMTLVLLLLLFIVYHVFWLELLLLYRSWFSTDERHSDDKEYDVYISYARNSEEEQFVLTTLRSILENELGYSVCIFDRDSLPGGTITDETLSFVARSRRLLVVVSPGYASLGSQALLELKAGIDAMALGGHLRVILIQYKPVQRQGWVRELQRARVALALVRWQGDKSKELTSRFWKRLRVELPVRSVDSREDAALMRLQSQNSTSSRTGCH